jgi:drug/metabolite transporter (DMT)-like permease
MYYLLLHIIVFIWGFTGILGDLISISVEHKVWFRMGIAFASLFLFNALYFRKTLPPKNEWKHLSLASFFIVMHWLFFFGSIETSTLSIGVVCMSTQAFMMSLLQPLIRGTKILLHEILLGVLVIIAIGLIFGFEYQHREGILIGLASSFFGVLFTIMNSGLIKRIPASMIASWEMGLGFVFLAIYLLLTNDFNWEEMQPKGNDLWYLLLLGTICTAVAFPVSVYIMKKLSAYAVSLSVNLEPVYTILLALLLFGEKEQMSAGFYAGTVILLISVSLESTFSRKFKKS